MKYKKKTLDNGLRIITAPIKDAPTATALILVETGSDYEKAEENGISHFLEHMFFKGTTKRSGSEINQKLDSSGAQSNAFTSNEFTGYYSKAHYKKLPVLLDVVSDIYLSSTIPAEEIEKERGVILEEINMYEDFPKRKVHDNLQSLMYSNQPAGRPIIGPKENIRKISRDDFIEYRQNNYVAKSTIVLVSGNIDEKKVIKDIESKFSDVNNKSKPKSPKINEKQKSPQIHLEEKKTDQSHIVFGFRAFKAKDKDSVVLSVLAAILGGGMSSRLFSEMRDQRGLCYYVFAHPDLYSNRGMLTVGSGVGNDRVDEAISVILEECGKLTEEIVGEKELKKAKDYLIGNTAMELESSDDVAMNYGLQEILTADIKKPNDQFKEIRSVTAKDIKRVAKKVIKADKVNLAIIGPHTDDKKFKKHFEILTKK